MFFLPKSFLSFYITKSRIFLITLYSLARTNLQISNATSSWQLTIFNNWQTAHISVKTWIVFTFFPFSISLSYTHSSLFSLFTLTNQPSDLWHYVSQKIPILDHLQAASISLKSIEFTDSLQHVNQAKFFLYFSSPHGPRRSEDIYTSAITSSEMAVSLQEL